MLTDWNIVTEFVKEYNVNYFKNLKTIRIII